MLNALKDLFDHVTQQFAGETPQDDEHALQLATAVLLVEVMRCDTDMKPTERKAVVASLRERFSLPGQAMDSLLAQAEQEAKTANDYFHFTSLLNDRLKHPQKIRVIENMWQVAYADHAIDANEMHLISKIAGLLYVTHGEYIAAKMRAKEAAEAAASGGIGRQKAPQMTTSQKLQPEG